MRNIRLFAIALCFLTPVLLGMGSLGVSDNKFPEPELDYHAVITDTEGVEHTASRISFNGKTSLSGFRGKATLSIDFKRIARVDVRKSDDKTYVYADLTLKDGRQVELKLKGLSRCYGVTDLGQISIRLRDLVRIVFDEKPPEPKD